MHLRESFILSEEDFGRALTKLAFISRNGCPNQFVNLRPKSFFSMGDSISLQTMIDVLFEYALICVEQMHKLGTWTT